MQRFAAAHMSEGRKVTHAVTEENAMITTNHRRKILTKLCATKKGMIAAMVWGSLGAVAGEVQPDVYIYIFYRGEYIYITGQVQ